MNDIFRDGNPLVSIVIPLYNSSATIVDTLDSIKQQTYQNIELVLSDDKSKDNTLDICYDWKRDNERRFVRVTIVEAIKNTGVTGNINRGVHVSNGAWIKTLAGDDLLDRNAISEYVKFVHQQKCMMCCCDLEVFSDTEQVPEIIVKNYNYYFRLLSESREDKLKRMASMYVIPGPGLFYSRALYNELEGLNEEYPMYEEFDFSYRTLKAGYQIYPLNKKLVRYRYSASSLSSGRVSIVGNKQLYIDRKNVFYRIQIMGLLKQLKILHIWSNLIYYFRGDIEMRFGKDSSISKCSIIFKYLDPLAYIRKIKTYFGYEV